MDAWQFDELTYSWLPSEGCTHTNLWMLCIQWISAKIPWQLITMEIIHHSS